VQGAGLAALRPLQGQCKERGLTGKGEPGPRSSIYCRIVSRADGPRDGQVDAPRFNLSPGGVASARSELPFVLGGGGPAIRAPASVPVTVAGPVPRVVISWTGSVRLTPRAQVSGVRLAPFPVVRRLGLAAVRAPASAVVPSDGSMRRAPRHS
jgi:hypothetical protein